jgi:hypothetical protein
VSGEDYQHQVDPSPTAETLIPDFLKDDINNKSATDIPQMANPNGQGKHKYFI